MSRKNRHQNTVSVQVENQDMISEQFNQELDQHNTEEVSAEQKEVPAAEEQQITNQETESLQEGEVLQEQKNEDEQAPAVEEPKEETCDELVKRLGSKSAAMRHLNACGKTRSQIAKFMNVRYQFVRNVLIQAGVK